VLGITDGATKVFRDPASFRAARAAHVSLELARNEVEPFQIVLFDPDRSLADVALQPSELVREDGRARLGPERIRVRQVREVKTDRPGYPVSRVGWWPDPLVETARFSVEAGAVQPVWIEVRTAADTAPGLYRGTITIAPSNAPPQTVSMAVTVWDFGLPAAGHLKTAFDFYPGRLRQAYERWVPEGAARWGDRMDELQHRYVLAMLEHRLSPIWNVDPVSDPSFGTRLNTYVSGGLTTFGIGPRGGSFSNDWPDAPEALEHAARPYRGMAEALRRLGVLDRAYVYAYDEPAVGDPNVARVAEALHRADSGLKNLVALGELRDPSADPAWWNDLDIVAVRNTAVRERHLAALRRMGKEIWLYVSGPKPPYPALVLDYPAMSARILPWMCWKAGARGLLYWCVNFWTTDPWREPKNTPWGQNGNGSLFYPGPDGPVGSIRLAALRDGLEDYEYLVLLSQAVARLDRHPAAAPSGVAGRLAEAKRLLAIDPKLVGSMRKYATDSAVLMRNRRAIAELIEELSRQ